MVGARCPRGACDWPRWPLEACLFRNDDDRTRFLDSLAERVEQYDIRLYLFVCMLNHFHLVFETPQANCSAFMQSLTTSYSVYYNLRHARHGHLFDGRFKAKLVEGDAYLLALSRYVHLNPVQVGELKRAPIRERIKVLRAYRWSSYPSYIGRRKALEFVEYGPLLTEMRGRRREWSRRYREFVETGLAESNNEFLDALELSARSIGSEAFRARVDELHRERLVTHARHEDVYFRDIRAVIPADTVLAILGELMGADTAAFKCRRHGSPLRPIASRLLIRYAGCTQREAADLLDIGSGSAVCKQLARLEERLRKDLSLRRLLKDAEDRIEKARRKRREAGRSAHA
jgi:putative transposase